MHYAAFECNGTVVWQGKIKQTYNSVSEYVGVFFVLAFFCHQPD